MKKGNVADQPTNQNVGGDVAVDLEAPKPRRSFWGKKIEQKEVVPPQPSKMPTPPEVEEENDGAEKIKEILQDTAPMPPTFSKQETATEEVIEVTPGQVKAALAEIAQKIMEVANIFPDDDAELQEREQYKRLKAKYG